MPKLEKDLLTEFRLRLAKIHGGLEAICKAMSKSGTQQWVAALQPIDNQASELLQICDQVEGGDGL